MKPKPAISPSRLAAAHSPRSALPIPHSDTVLFAVTGMSPAILTETAWALAQAKPPVIPQRVVALTTMPGKARIEDELFTPSPDYAGLSVWQALRRAVLGPQFETDPRLNLDEVRLIARRDPKLGRAFPLEDIRTPADNDTAADFILEELRKLTENADTRVIASLAGGRKTMGALLYAALSLLGRAQDRLTHVLVSEPFEDPGLRPRFYFPMQPDTLHQHPRTGGVHRGDAARIWLADVPFVRLRELFPRQLGHYPGTFSGLVQAYGQHIETLSGPPEVALDAAGSALQVHGNRVTLAPRELALYTFLLERAATPPPLTPSKKTPSKTSSDGSPPGDADSHRSLGKGNWQKPGNLPPTTISANNSVPSARNSPPLGWLASSRTCFPSAAPSACACE